MKRYIAGGIVMENISDWGIERFVMLSGRRWAFWVAILTLVTLQIPSPTLFSMSFPAIQSAPDGNIDSTGRPHGPLIGLRVGAQTNGLTLNESWSTSLTYRPVWDAKLSTYFELHLWRHLLFQSDVVGKNSSSIYGTLNVGLQWSANLSERVILGVSGGIGSPLVYPISFHYGLALEYVYSDNLLIVLGQKRYGLPDLNHFLSIGIFVPN